MNMVRCNRYKFLFELPLVIRQDNSMVINFFYVIFTPIYVSAYYAQTAGLDYGLSISDNGFEVSLCTRILTLPCVLCSVSLMFD